MAARVRVGQGGDVTDAAPDLLRGVRGRRLCLEYVTRVDPNVRDAVFWAARELDVHPGILLRVRIVDGEAEPGDDPDDDPRFSGADVASLIRAADLPDPEEEVVRAALRATVDAARYWQDPDGTDVLASLPDVREALRGSAVRVADALPALAVPRGRQQWAVEWSAKDAAEPGWGVAADLLADWSRSQQEEEEGAAREWPADATAQFSATWWSLPMRLLTTRGTIRDALELVEDSLGWDVATVIPVRGAGSTLEIRSASDWADLCRAYPREVTASRKYDWYRVTGRIGRWLIPDWQRVAERWDAVHLTTYGYLEAATELIEIDADYASVIGGWGPDSTIWLADVVREEVGGRQEWTRPRNSELWSRSPDRPEAPGVTG